jgi:hypothetical protein
MHIAVMITTAANINQYPTLIAAGGTTGANGASQINAARFGLTEMFTRNRNTSGNSVFGEQNATGLVGATRNNSSNFTLRVSGSNYIFTRASQAPFNGNYAIFAGDVNLPNSNARLAFYSIGESLNLALLDARVSTLMTALAAAIP